LLAQPLFKLAVIEGIHVRDNQGSDHWFSSFRVLRMC
jgi:hypothetical protein